MERGECSYIFDLLDDHDETISPVPVVTFHLQDAVSKLQSHCICSIGLGVGINGFWVDGVNWPQGPALTESVVPFAGR